MPHKNESKEQYISRCIPYMIDEEGKEQDQAVAMCYAFWKQYGPDKDESVRVCNMDIINKIDSMLNESMQRYCSIYRAKNNKWYLELADREYGDRDDATTYGPFDSEDEAEKYINNFSNPGGWMSYGSGKKPVPTKSPNGSIVIAPVSSSSRRSPVKFRRQW